jgi:DNA-directed RNA polymerase specialized sigma24 family protein
MKAKFPGRTSLIRRWRGSTRVRNKEFEGTLFNEIYTALLEIARQADFTRTVDPAELVNKIYEKWQAGAALKDWQSRMEFYTFARRALRNIVIDGYRERKNLRTEILFEDSGVCAAFHLDFVNVEEIIEQIGQETPAYGEVLTLKIFSHHTDDEIAEALGVAEATAKRYCVVAKAKFRKRLENNPPLI